ncbi:MAG: GNAT family N-acetyltransferase [Acidocella sp.]|nr:GNAT family N-acetyltransferase [Acidocella sp.]
MSLPATRRFDPARVFHPESVALSGAHTAIGQRVLANLQSGGYRGTLALEPDACANADLALVADDPGDIPAALARHAARGARGAIVLSDTYDLGAQAKAAGIRVLGPHSYGLVLPGLGLNASDFTVIPPRGRIALVGQSPSLARIVIDWAVPNAVGFSHIIGIGGNTDIGFGLVLDHLSRDPGTAAILVEIDRLRHPKLFHSAARAAARLRPVIAILPGLRLRDTQGGAHAAMEASFARAGVLLTGTMGEFLAAAETLTRVRPARGESLTIIANSLAAGRLAADFALETGLVLTQLSAETAQVLSLRLGRVPEPGPIFARGGATQLAELAALLSSAPEVGGILVVHAPSGEDDDTVIEALVACARAVHVPLLIAAMGESRGLAHRHRLAAAGLACFDTPESAIIGFRHLLANRRNRAAARELPATTVLQVAPDTGLVTARIAAARAALRHNLVQDEALAIIQAYDIPVLESRYAATPLQACEAAAALGFPVVVKLSHPDMPTSRLPGSVVLDLNSPGAVRAACANIARRARAAGVRNKTGAPGFLVQRQAPRGVALRIRVADNATLGPTIGFGAGGGEPDEWAGLAADLPPLNLALAQALIRRAAIAPALNAHRGMPAADFDAIAATLVRVSQLVIDTPDILLLDLDPVFAHPAGVVAASARITLRAPGATRPPLIISPYPSGMVSHHSARGHHFTLRPIRPEDADAHAAMFARFTQDDMRYRFFSAIRALPTEQITRMTDIDYAREMAIIAVWDTTAETAGAARLVRNDTDGLSAEFAVAVEPAAKGLGLATALMRAVIAWGKAQGVQEITGTILADNAPMLAFIRRLGFAIERMPGESDVVEARLTP